MISKEILSAILQGIDEGIHAVNLSGETIFYNPIAAAHDGLVVEEVIGKSILEVFPSLTRHSSTLLKVILTKKPIYNQVQRYVNLHGKKIETINTTLPIFIDGELAGAVEIAKDYSRLKMLSEKLLDLQQRMQKRYGNNAGSKGSTAYQFSSLKSINPEFISMITGAERLAKSDSPILVYGESGTGKELFVHGVHHASVRAQGPFIVQNCAAIPEALLESLLFGTSRGSYTGAVERAGLFELADGGTLFLDELHAMPIELQAKLLRVIEDGMIRRVGSTKSHYVNVRVIAAMNISPNEALEARMLRPDLFYRLNVLMFRLPPLRERSEDIPYLTDYFLSLYNKKLQKQITVIDKQVRQLFLSYSWPGNVRELKHAVEYMMTVCEGNALTLEELPIMLKKNWQVTEERTMEHQVSLREKIDQYERSMIHQAMLQSEGNIQKAAKLLCIPRQTLQYKLKKQN
ncbi:sigma-54 interaction domain-containing protein [Bacillus tuaregi]|uniref:sigma-54 interaction domain-containing protein n=1 Tax=Bacillus tuaregi TaxID=1816695 RepID=UPI0008F9505B|nr:sigma 54-interacting transcriptional regulator [Bacillus tuaregi]